MVISSGWAFRETISIPDVDEMVIGTSGDLFGGLGDTVAVLAGSGRALNVIWPNCFPNWAYPVWGFFSAFSFSSNSAALMKPLLPSASTSLIFLSESERDGFLLCPDNCSELTFTYLAVDFLSRFLRLTVG